MVTFRDDDITSPASGFCVIANAAVVQPSSTVTKLVKSGTLYLQPLTGVAGYSATFAVIVGVVMSATVISLVATFDKQLFASSTCNCNVYVCEQPAFGTLTVDVTVVSVVLLIGFAVVTAKSPSLVHLYV